jgi:hypothetical protein
MPKTQMDYSKGFIYRLVCKDLSVKELYVGSSTNFRQRKSSHKSRCTKEGNRKYHYNVYQYIRDNGGWDNWDMIEIEKYPCNDEHELAKRERYWIEELKASLNTSIPTRTKQELMNTTEYKQYKKEYDSERNKNPEVIKKRKEQQKKYNEENKEKIAKQKKEYNKERRKIKISCECGSIIKKEYISKHYKTIKHQNFIKSQE